MSNKIIVTVNVHFANAIEHQLGKVNFGQLVRSVESAINSQTQLDAVKDGKQTSRIGGTKDKRVFKLNQGQSLMYVGPVNNPARFMALNTWFDTNTAALSKITGDASVLDEMPINHRLAEWIAEVCNPEKKCETQTTPAAV